MNASSTRPATTFTATLVATLALAWLAALPAGAQSLDVTDNLIIHLDASLGVVEDTGGVAQWFDQADRGGIQEAQLNDPNRRPDLVPGFLNGLPIIRFDGVDDSLLILDNVTDDLLDGNNTLSWFTVHRETDAAGTVLRTRYDGASGSTTLWGTFQSSGTGNPIYSHARNAAGVMRGEQNPNTQNFMTVAAVWDGAAPDQPVMQWLNGVRGTPHASGNTGADNPATEFNRLRIAQDANGGNPSELDIAEILVYDRALSEVEAASVTQYLKVKYGMVTASDLPTQDGLVIHFDGASAMTDGAGNVEFWHNRAQGRYTAGQGAADRRPELVPGELNGLDVLRFDGVQDATGDMLLTDYVPESTDDLTVFVVGKQSGTPYSGGSRLKILTAAGDPAYGQGIFALTNNRNDNNQVEVASHNSEQNFITDSFADGSFHVMAGVVDNGDVLLGYYDGGQTQRVGVSGTPLVGQLTIGGHTSSDNRQFSGDMAEVIVFDRALSNNEANRVGYYLQEKYGLAGAYTPTSQRARWKLDEPAGAAVAVDSVSINDGAIMGATPGGPGPNGMGGSYAFNGTSDFVELTDSVANFAGLTQGTITGWFQTTGTGTHVILDASDRGDASSEIRLMVERDQLKYDVRGDDGPVSGQLVGAYAVNDGRWHHAAVTVDAGQQAVLYLDGNPVAADAEPFFAGVFDLDQMAIGRNVDSGGPQWHFNGSLSDVAVYDEPLSRSQLLDVMQNGAVEEPAGAPTVTLAYWTFQEQVAPALQDDRVIDYSGSGRDARIGGAQNQPTVVEGNPAWGDNVALHFDNSAESVIFQPYWDGFNGGGPEAGAPLDFGPGESFTIEAGVRMPDGLTGVQSPVSRQGGDGEWWIRVEDGRLRYLDDPNGDGTANRNDFWAEPGFEINDGLWHHVAVVRDAELQEYRMYVDYELAGVLENADMGELISDQLLRIGLYNNGGRAWVGDVDFVRITSGALDITALPVPEPSSLALAALAGVGLCALLWRRRTRVRTG